VRDEGAEIPTHDAVPGRPFPLIKLEAVRDHAMGFASLWEVAVQSS
jgi:hypothetical protein